MNNRWETNDETFTLFQDDVAKDEDIHGNVSITMKKHFKRKSKPSLSTAGIRIVTVSRTSYHYQTTIYRIAGKFSCLQLESLSLVLTYSI